MPVAASDALKLFEVLPKPPPRIEKITPPRVGSKKPKDAASPPNLKAKPTEIVAPPPVVLPIVPPSVTAASTPGVGSDPSAGASDVSGPGTGSGGQGTGTGGGGAGEGKRVAEGRGMHGVGKEGGRQTIK